MTGFVGGVTSGAVGEVQAAMHGEPWYERERVSAGEHTLGSTHHGARDPPSHTVQHDDGVVGVVHGAIPNRDSNDLDTTELLRAVLDTPLDVLPEIDGSFVIACADAERVVVATDKLGTRPCYYRADESSAPLFGSSLSALLTRIDSATIDRQTVSDVLLMGHAWGEHTLLEEVRALPPATVLEYTDDGTRTRRYWQPEFVPTARDGYFRELIGRYRNAMADVSTTIEDEAGLWLSGGLDSRSMAAELHRNASVGRFDTLEAYTYDANPTGGGNPDLARRIAAHLGIDVVEVELGPERFLETVEDAITLVDGMLSWVSFLNLTTTFELPDDRANVLLEGAGQGELIGQHPRRSHLGADSAVEGLYHSEAMIDATDVRALTATDVDPLDSFRESVTASDEPTTERRILDCNYANYYSRAAFVGDQVARSQAGTRVPFCHGEFLSHTARLPPAHRMGTLPFTSGKVPYGITRGKHALARALPAGLDRIPYERTGIAPSRRFVAQAIGFVATTALARLRSQTTYGGTRAADEWYRTHEGVRRFIDGLLEDACARQVFDAHAIRKHRAEHLRGEANHVMGSLAAITTLESWFQQHLD